MADESNPEPTKGGVQKGVARPRSPNYPGITIQEAIEHIKTIYAKEIRNEAPEIALLKHWGYNPNSGGGYVVLAALKAFGLLEKGKTPTGFKLTDLAFKIVVDKRETSVERKRLIQEAALKPPLHRLMWEKYKTELPSDDTFSYHLMTERQFTESGAKQFIAKYRETLKFAGLLEGGTIPGGAEDNPPSEDRPMTTSPAEPARQPLPMPLLHVPGMREVPIPISGTAWPIIKAAFPLSKAAWEQMMLILRAMEPGLVSDPASEQKVPEK